MHFDLVKIFSSMGGMALVVVGVLGLMGIASMAVFVERLWVYARSRGRNADFASKAAGLLDRGSYAEVAKEADGAIGSHLAALLATGIKTFLAGESKGPKKVTAVELARRELARKSEAQAAELRRGMSVLASVGSVAPFVGLLGTVVGIIAAFQGIAKEGSGGLGAVSGGIAEALVVTAFGLMVAIPSVLAFNFLTTQSEKILLALDHARGELIDHLEGAGEPAGKKQAERSESANGNGNGNGGHRQQGEVSAA